MAVGLGETLGEGFGGVTTGLGTGETEGVGTGEVLGLGGVAGVTGVTGIKAVKVSKAKTLGILVLIASILNNGTTITNIVSKATAGRVEI